MLRGIRGAITVRSNTKEEIIDAVKRLLSEIAEQNKIRADEVASVFFSVTDDLNAAFPAEAARIIGWKDTALLCTREIPVPKSLEKCVRVLLHVNTHMPQMKMKHVYLEGAKILRRQRT
ncbi:chorismate mutase [candidate division WOR-1 bacterium RIFOXYA12_FULL_43_27]|uniref:chorismate mutase n=1 Tax=candidate division WOR-1 bacterium RIFOXYC2_FULL_46_14 TaxID=1802587 RepID=A0A1F4U7M8_UNCSA|nr:MAG: chorismate mutase [candidate division WOR-1 bacterium RIFOXYA12_FULL_43_27]OGC19312.1 MAG: chorismate mutase [candidate division WOR-1 bacterium RIFOXYB2_FULL_46_45]OGC30301.1 MAG: chorismate mutase [candidate division WOR-1 bacterium RIFOXYA2_FULL_46_56]OGC40902.1 MAG: chorismate mutase [candidate division WOR-1 bacterium RIFOXYC2_FULL_46_14]